MWGVNNLITMFKQIIFIFLIILAYLVETSATPLPILKYFDLTLIVILIYNFYYSFNLRSFILPFSAGFLKDSVSPNFFGLYIFLFILIIVIVNFCKNKFLSRFNIISPILITILATAIYYLCPLILSFFLPLSYRYNFTYLIWRPILFSVFLNSIIILFIYWLKSQANRYFNKRFISLF